jgi:hypothetical protein
VTAPATLRRYVAAIARHLRPDELELLVLLVRRVWGGQAHYGYLDLRPDRRAFAREAPAGASFYLAGAVLRRRGAR